MKPLVICLLILHTIGHVTMTSSVTVADSSSSSEVMSSSETITTEDPTTESTPPSGSASVVVYTMLFVLDTNIYENATNETLNNANSTEYKAIERGLDDFWKTKLGDLLVNVTIVLIRKGSLIVDHAVQTKTESTGKVLTAAIDLVNGASNVNIGTESVSAISSNVTTSSGTTVQIDKASNPNVCDLYTTLAPCTPLQTCKISNGQPSCVNLNVSQQVVVYTMLFVLDTNIYQNKTNDTLNNADSKEYEAIETGLVDFWETKLGNLLVSVTILSIRKGSLIVEHTVQTKTESTGKVLTAANDLVNGPSTVAIGNETVSAISSNVSTSAGRKVQIVQASNPDLCDLYRTLAPCTSLQTCKISNGQPSCVNLNVSQEDNLPVIIFIGGVLLILTLPLIFVLLDMHKKRKDRRESKSNSGSPIYHEIPMGLTCNSIKGGPDFNPAFTGSDAGSEMDDPQGFGDFGNLGRTK